MDILDTASMQVSGDGLSVAEVNRRARFAISTGDDGSGRHLRIIVTCKFYLQYYTNVRVTKTLPPYHFVFEYLFLS